MTWWIVILLLGAALSPLVWLKPSNRQRGQMALRLAARRQGLGMQLAQQDWPYWMTERAPVQCAQYHRARRRERTDAWSYWQEQSGQWCNQWREPCADAQLLVQLQSLPEDVYRIEATPQMLAVYWGERGAQPELDKVLTVMNELA